MTVRTLKSICREVLLLNLDKLQNVGSAHYQDIEFALRRCSAQQLACIEQHSPHLLRDTHALWHALNQADFGDDSEAYTPLIDYRARYVAAEANIERKRQVTSEKLKRQTADLEAHRKAHTTVMIEPPTKRVKTKPRHVPGGLMAKLRRKTTQSQRLREATTSSRPAPAPPPPVRMLTTPVTPSAPTQKTSQPLTVEQRVPPRSAAPSIFITRKKRLT
ncbi:uncharacterized protein L969DRAFT_19160 [Mixia osmundae IAM 14324]|uniref:Elongin-A n=1 Tax=Mixia osmundae (strain CBS 9802 / IAM 14324 / JCM 22182 / KY 12970) TaxID=764103 RepID=G7E4P0_MIXOS|nr:uncharacterized protein L969DRAFT_19160 [Mixia osmundae IAM 14324]KEI37683.1 hypothetical protein L969DRAFT_19160 [Mixia osmundae IAM 14324]GAA97800.1 hypothetical protein E5Q_04479 [Mixia osmundae IAM 14324]